MNNEERVGRAVGRIAFAVGIVAMVAGVINRSGYLVVFGFAAVCQGAVFGWE